MRNCCQFRINKMHTREKRAELMQSAITASPLMHKLHAREKKA